MNLGQMMLVIGAVSLLGILILNTNSTLMDSYETTNNSEFEITAVSLATSLVEEAMGKMFDEVIADSNTTTLTNPNQLSTLLGYDGVEKFRDTAASVTDFDDFDDFNNLFVVYKSDLAAEAAPTPGSHHEFAVPGMRAKYYVTAKVVYVDPTNLDGASASRTWHKKIIVTVTSPSVKDTLRFPAIMSYWN
ncbi:MAG: hypothetical protein OEM41_03305 [Ignavibacteria bacterium]|nr:hypothetical protein [Ignavibacteria bacterium]